MSFTTLMYHELREKAAFDPKHPSVIDVGQNYRDILPPPLFVTLEHFEEQMAYLRDKHYHTLSLDEVKAFYYNGKSLPQKSVLLTFDDCYQSVKKYAYPLLREFGFHAVAFVVTGWLHTSPKPFDPDRSVCMAQEELSDIADVFEFANHTASFHTRINAAQSILMTAGDGELSRDLELCNEKSYITGKDVFAYPFGLYEDRNISLLKEKGFRLAFTSTPGKNDENTDPLLLKRNAVPYFLELNEFREML